MAAPLYPCPLRSAPRSLSFSSGFCTFFVSSNFSVRPPFFLSSPKPRSPSNFHLLRNPFSSACSSSHTGSPDFGLVSTTELSDGSILFRFGNVNETVKHSGNKDKAAMAEDACPAPIALPSPEGENHDAVEISDDTDHPRRPKTLRDIWGPSLEKEVKSHLEMETEKISHSSSEFADTACQTIDSSNVVGGAASDEDTSTIPDMKTNQSLGAVLVPEATCSFIGTGSAEGSGGNYTAVGVSDLEDASEAEERMTKVEDIITQSASSVSESESIASSSYAAMEYDDSEEKTNGELMHVSPAAEVGDVLGGSSLVCDETSTRDGVEVMPVSSLLEAEPLLDEETTHSLLDDSVDVHMIPPSRPVAESSYSILKGEVGEFDAQNSDTLQISNPKAEETEAIRDGLEDLASGFFLSSGAAIRAHPSKALTGGEDAYFVCHNWLGVADGVSQWSFEGINPGVYAREFMKNCERIVCDSKTSLIFRPEDVIVRSAAETHSPGSSTVLIAYCDGQALYVANIGDSGFIVIRDGSVLVKSSPMLHEFCFPLQIGRGDDPSEYLEQYKMDLNEGDIIVVATDGLFDNLYDQEIISNVTESVQASSKPEEIAGLLATRAQEVGQSTSARSPFADAAQAAGYVAYTGGKLDDVAVVVSFVRCSTVDTVQRLS